MVVLISESKAKIVGPAEVYVKKGSTLSLTCLVSQAVENAVIFWYHDANVLDNSGPHHVASASASMHSASTSSLPRVFIDLSYDPATSSLTMESGRLFHLEVLARDKGTPSLSSTGLIEIRVADASGTDIGTPASVILRFQNATYNVQLPENAPVGKDVVQVNGK